MHRKTPPSSAVGLTVVLGIEVSTLFDCGLADGVPLCERTKIDRQLEEVHRMVVRQLVSAETRARRVGSGTSATGRRAAAGPLTANNSACAGVPRTASVASHALRDLVTPYAGDSTGFVPAWRETRVKRFFFGFGDGSDISGLGAQGNARTVAKNPVTHPFRGVGGVRVDRQRAGQRRGDIGPCAGRQRGRRRRSGQRTRTTPPVGISPRSQTMSMAARLTRAHPCDAG